MCASCQPYLLSARIQFLTLRAPRFHAWEIYKRLLRSRSINGAQREVNVELLVEGFKVASFALVIR